MQPQRSHQTCSTKTATRLLRSASLLGLWAVCGVAGAQLHVPSMPSMPSMPGLGNMGQINDARSRIDSVTDKALAELDQSIGLRQAQIADLLRLHGAVLEADPLGQLIVRHEILAWSPSADGLAAALAAGLSIARENSLDGLDASLVVLRVPDQARTARLLQQLRTIDPDGVYDFNHLYLRSAGGTAGIERDASAMAIGNAAPEGARGASQASRVGLIDSGVAGNHIVFRGARIVRWGCNGAPHPAEHGTAVAALMVGQAGRFHGAAPGAILYAADIYCDSPSGGSADQISQALAWLAREKIGVINLSLVGPPNLALEKVVGAMVKRGHLLVAAVGNDGPAAAPLFPASYPGVIGVSAVDLQRRPLPEAARGPQVMFAAPGSSMASAALGAPPYRQVRGTSFAAPIVAGLLAVQLNQPDPAAAQRAIALLAKQASNARAAIISNATGYGVVGEALRIDPAQLR